MSHSCYNPIIYCYMNARFRGGFLQIMYRVPGLRRCCCLHRYLRSRGDRSYEATGEVTFKYYNRRNGDGLVRKPKIRIRCLPSLSTTIKLLSFSKSCCRLWKIKQTQQTQSVPFRPCMIYTKHTEKKILNLEHALVHKSVKDCIS